ncbi:RNA methyltransferase [Niveomyces insectorum RCEF 264]|uniref:rRNA methyltransferase 1, mitochondrial n=1 Tax=Niveomyces insectorum RCEF 264 TaxID=1081102 RepID=A0A168AFM3_9HYPO|nr:RNA methyltransferase [Niveomyces insectorum RCEF 264]
MPSFTSPAAAAAKSCVFWLSRKTHALHGPPQHAFLPCAFRRPSSMSAIVRGLRRTFRDKGQRPPGYDAGVAERVRERRLLREATPKPTYRIFRGKKDVTEDPFPKPKTRQKRFFDPEDQFGKKSLVYKAKSGELQAELEALAAKQKGGEPKQEPDREFEHGRRDRDRRSFYDDGNGYGNDLSARKPERRRPRSGPTGDGGGYRRSAFESGPARRFERKRADDRYERWPERRSEKRRPDERSEQSWEESFNEELERARHDGDARSAGRNRSSRGSARSPEVPLTIPYTTAASQFLYGRSVVSAALRSARRRLYKLYIYGGAKRNSSPQDVRANEAIEGLARRAGVETVVVDERWQRLLDKMSKGRPHNGYILEASPLPQPLVTALGAFTERREDAALDSGPGFHIELGYQSREEVDVNGAADFVPVSLTKVAPAARTNATNTDYQQQQEQQQQRHYKPLVLLLDQVLDPGNLGAILRSASFLGVSAVAISKGSSAGLTSVALKASAGASEAMTLFSVDVPATFLAQSKAAGWKVYAAVPSPSPRRRGVDLDGLEAADPLQDEACILVVGSEGEGLPRAIRREADVEVSVANRSGSDVVDSLNVSVATGLLCASFLKGAMRSSTDSKQAKPTERDGGLHENDEASRKNEELGLW